MKARDRRENICKKGKKGKERGKRNRDKYETIGKEKKVSKE